MNIAPDEVGGKEGNASDESHRDVRNNGSEYPSFQNREEIISTG
jgi:hypothetical protein